MKQDDLASIGERKAIDIVSRLLTRADIPVGIGDDCAALDMGDDYLLITTDMINQRTHTPKATARQMGWHLVAINISDIGSKGGRPLGLVTALGLPSGMNISFLKELVKGIDGCARRFDTRVIGGDTKESRDINLVATAFGQVRKEDFMPRSGARPGDLLAITGTLGLAAAGLEALRVKMRRPKAIKALLEPWPRVREGIDLGRTHAVTSCIDTSDGLSTSLHHIAKASAVGFKVVHELLPISNEVEKVGLDIDDAILHFGGEYELLMTVRPDRLDEVREVVEGHGTRFTVIGETTKKGIHLHKKDKRSMLKNLGWEHFKPVKRMRKVKRSRVGAQRKRKKKR